MWYIKVWLLKPISDVIIPFLWVTSTPQSFPLAAITALVAALVTALISVLLGIYNSRRVDARERMAHERADARERMAHEWVDARTREVSLVSDARAKADREAVDQRERERGRHERFAQVVEQLASTKPAVRLGGLYALSALADEWQLREEHLLSLDEELEKHETDTSSFSNRLNVDESLLGENQVQEFVDPRVLVARGQRDACIELVCAYLRGDPISNASWDGQYHAASTREANADEPNSVNQTNEWGENVNELPLQNYGILSAWGQNPKLIPDYDARQAALAILREHTLGNSRFRWPSAQIRLTGAHLEGADLSGTYLNRANLSSAWLERAILDGTHLENASLESAHLNGAFLDGGHFKEADFTKAEMQKTTLFRADLTHAWLNHAHLEKAWLDSTVLKNAIMNETHLDNSSLNKTHLEGAIMSNVTLQGARLRGSFLQESELTKADLRNSHIERCYFESASLMEANLAGANLIGNYFNGTFLQWADLSQAKIGLSGDKETWFFAIFSLSEEDKLVAKMAQWNSGTTWPSGINIDEIIKRQKEIWATKSPITIFDDDWM